MTENEADGRTLAARYLKGLNEWMSCAQWIPQFARLPELSVRARKLLGRVAAARLLADLRS